MADEPVINTWTGSSTFAAGETPYGHFDADGDFATDIDKFSKWAARRLGYPIVDVELISDNFYAAYEESVMKYGYYLHMYAARDLLMDVQGSPIGALNFTGNYVQASLSGVFKVAEQYGVAAPSGGSQNQYQGFINTTAGKQVYNLTDDTDTELELGDPTSDEFTIRKVYHSPSPASSRYITQAAGAGTNQALIDEFGMNGVGSDYLLTPLNSDVQRIQAVELNDQIRKSHYGFKLTGDKIRIFPVPTHATKIYFDYTLESEDINIDQSESLISDISNIPYDNLKYSATNSIARNWMQRYALALCKEMLGFVRGKYSQIPIPDTEITLNSDDLLTQAAAEQESLIEEIKEFLDSFGSKAQLEKKAAEAEYLEQHLAGVPMKMYIK